MRLCVNCVQRAIQCGLVSQTPMAQQHFRESKVQQHCSEVASFVEEIHGQKDVEGLALPYAYTGIRINQITFIFLMKP